MFADSKTNSVGLSRVRSIIAVAAGKGGVGKSTVALNLSLVLAAQGKKVGLLDADIYGPSVRKMLLEERPPQHGQGLIAPALGSNVHFVSMAHFFSDKETLSVRAPVANGFVKQLIYGIEWGELDYLFVDFPPGTGDIQLTLVQEMKFTGAVLVSTPQEVALLDVSRAMRLFDHCHVPLIGILENMSYFAVGKDSERVYPFGVGRVELFALDRGCYFLGQIPIDPATSQCCDQGISLFNDCAATLGAAAFVRAAALVEDQLHALETLRGMSS